MQYEHKFEVLHSPTPERLSKLMDENGRRGWRTVGVIKSDTAADSDLRLSGTVDWTVFLEREIGE